MAIGVKGTIKAEDLGVVALCEYMLYGLVGWENDPWINFDRPKAFDAIVKALKELKAAGGKTIVDYGGELLGRNTKMLTDIAAAVDVNIIASTGFGSQETIPGHFLMPLTERALRDKAQKDVKVKMWVPDANYLGDLFYDELTKGMVMPGMMRSKSRAGIIRTGSGWDKITEIEELSLRGAAAAAKKTGACVITESVNQAERHMALMMGEGLEPERIIIGHCDDKRAIDLERDKKIAQKGAFVAYNHIGWEDASIPHSIPDDRRVEMIKTMVEAGFAKNIVLSCSAIGYAIDVPQPKHSFAHLLKTFVPKLKKAGISDSAINTMLVENPRRILAGL
ncbi:MAG: hypothetical protein V1767_04060 [Chloroflexota bacterium]